MKTSTTHNNLRVKHWIECALAVFFWLLVWQAVSMAVQQEILMVSPLRVCQRFFALGTEKEFWLSAVFSMARILSGFLLAVLFGTVLAVCTVRFSAVHILFFPLLSAIKATPVASFIILALVWLRSGFVPIFTAFLIALPLVWSNVSSGISKTDLKLLQMAHIYHFGAWKTLRLVYIPSVLPYFTAACTTGLGLAWKAGVAAEVLSSTKLSIGGHIYAAKIYLETADLFAWTLLVIAMSVLLEFAMVRLMRKARYLRKKS